MSPNLAIQEALYAAISVPGLTLNGVIVPVYTHVPPAVQGPYVLLTQVITVPTTGSTSCQRWRSIFQFTVVTTYENTGSDLPALLLEGQIISLLDGQILPLTWDYQMQSNRIVLTKNTTEYDGKLVHIIRYIQLEITVYQDK